MRRWVAPIAAALVLTGCGGGYEKYEGAKGSAYEIEHEACGESPPEKVASDLGVREDPNTSEGLERIAAKASERYEEGPVREGAYEGCLDGLRKQR